MSPKTRSPKNSKRSLDSVPMLAWDRARIKRLRSENLWPSRSPRAGRLSSTGDFADPVIPERERPLPDVPEPRGASGREENNLRLADKNLERNIAYVHSGVVG